MKGNLMVAHPNESSIRAQERRLFFRRWLKEPRRLGTVAPISTKLAKLAASLVVDPKGSPIVEIGAGTGRLTRALLEAGLDPAQLTLVELDKELCSFLKETLPGIKVIEGDASYLSQLLDQNQIGQVATVVSAIPFMYLKEEQREAIAQACFDVLKPGGDLLHVTYNCKSPLAQVSFLDQERVGAVWGNLPPGFVWRYRKAAS